MIHDRLDRGKTASRRPFTVGATAYAAVCRDWIMLRKPEPPLECSGGVVAQMRRRKPDIANQEGVDEHVNQKPELCLP